MRWPDDDRLRTGRAGPRLAWLLVAWLAWAAAAAQPTSGWPGVALKAVLGQKALLQIDGEQVMLARGQTRAGVTLLEVSPDRVRVGFGDESLEIGFGASVTSQFAEREAVETRLYPDSQGMYFTVGSINGFPVRFLLDTGATYVGLDAALARRVGIRYDIDGRRESVRTASGTEPVYRVRLDSVRVGDITLRNVDAHVLEGEGMGLPLLGMSFLSRLQVRNEGGAMVLRHER